MAQAPDLRVSDDDRERVATAIREHYSAGRLNSTEFEERLHATYTARTESELATIQADLPPLTLGPKPLSKALSEEEAAIAQRRAGLQRRLFHTGGLGLVFFVVCLVIWAATGANDSFWPKWALVVAALAVARPAWNMWGPSPDLDQVERDLDQIQRDLGGHPRRRRRRLGP